MKAKQFKDLVSVFFCSAMLFSIVLSPTNGFAHEQADDRRFVQVAAESREERSRIADLGVSIEAVRSDSVWGFADSQSLSALRKAGIKILGDHDLSVARGGHDTLFGDFPEKDSRFHNYAELTTALNAIATAHPDLAKVRSIGKSVEGRDIWAIHFNSSAEALKTGQSTKPGAVYLGAHHAREHLSVEVPLMFAQYLADNRAEPAVKALLESRDIWIVPMVNPDGAEFDISTGRYQLWRKNRRDNGNRTMGVDLNRNYGFQWGTGGSSKNSGSDVYMGPEPFSEPESQAIRDFVTERENTRVLLSFHTFSELILYPWGHKYDPIANKRDQEVFVKMATQMSTWNKYKPQAASSLYIASGDTVDWAYGERGIFAFTFELSPDGSIWNTIGGRGFYPGAGIIDSTFAANLKPALYLLEMAADPYQALTDEPTGMLRNYVEPRVPANWQSLPW